MGMMMVVSSQHVGRERGDTNWKGESLRGKQDRKKNE